MNNDSAQGAGWVGFAGIMILFVAVLNILWGISAISNSHFLINGNHFVIEDRNAYGWIALIVGVVQLFAAFSIFAGHEFGRWIGIIVAALSGIHQLSAMQSYPWFALAILAIDIMIIYGLVVYGGRQGPLGQARD